MHGVGVEQRPLAVAFHRQFQARALGLERGTKAFHGFLDGGRQVPRFGAHGQPATLQPGESQHVGHHATEPLYLVGDASGVGPMLRAVARAVGQHFAVEAQAGQRRAQLVGRRRCELLPVARQPVDLSDQTDQKDAGHEGCQRSAAEGPGETPGNRAGLGGRGGHSLGGIRFYDPILAHRQQRGGLQRVRGPRSHSCRENRALEHGVHGTREQDEPLGQPGRRCRDLAQRNQRRSLLDRNRVPMEGSDRGHAAGRLNQARLGRVGPFAHGCKPCRGRALQLVEDRELGRGRPRTGTVGGG